MKRIIAVPVCFFLLCGCNGKPEEQLNETSSVDLDPAVLSVRSAVGEDLVNDCFKKLDLGAEDIGLVLSVNVPVEDLTLYALSLDHETEDGIWIGTRDEVYFIKQFKPEEPLLVLAEVMEGDVNLGVSFVEQDGKVTDLGITRSGFDDSLAFVHVSVFAPKE